MTLARPMRRGGKAHAPQSHDDHRPVGRLRNRQQRTRAEVSRQDELRDEPGGAVDQRSSVSTEFQSARHRPV